MTLPLARYPHALWTIDDRPVIVTGEWAESDSSNGYMFYYENDRDQIVHWITTLSSYVRAKPRREVTEVAKQNTEAASNDACRSPQSEVREEDGHSTEGSERIRSGGQET